MGPVSCGPLSAFFWCIEQTIRYQNLSEVNTPVFRLPATQPICKRAIFVLPVVSGQVTRIFNQWLSRSGEAQAFGSALPKVLGARPWVAGLGA